MAPRNTLNVLSPRYNDYVSLPKVRYAVVVVLKEVYSRLGNEFMSLLPETIPFLAELLEGNVTTHVRAIFEAASTYIFYEHEATKGVY